VVEDNSRTHKHPSWFLHLYAHLIVALVLPFSIFIVVLSSVIISLRICFTKMSFKFSGLCLLSVSIKQRKTNGSAELATS
jgi:hypothetical protein